MMAISITISEMYFHPCFVQSIYVDNPVLSEPLFGGAENFPHFIPSILLLRLRCIMGISICTIVHL